MRPVGILGGMGPEATILLMQKCLHAVPARDDADHIPLIVHQNPQVPSRIKALLEGGGIDPAPVLAGMARALEAAGAMALAMPCNTAHHYADAVRAASDLPFLDMVEATGDALAGASRVGVLASPALRRVGVLDAPFAARGVELVWPEDEAEVLRLIRAVKAGEEPVTLAPAMGRAAEALAGAGCDRVLVACTELSLLTGGLPEGLRWTDSLDCLTAAIVAHAKG